jgi:hypothetical protein
VEGGIANDHAIIPHHTDERMVSETIRRSFGLNKIAAPAMHPHPPLRRPRRRRHR